MNEDDYDDNGASSAEEDDEQEENDAMDVDEDGDDGGDGDGDDGGDDDDDGDNDDDDAEGDNDNDDDDDEDHDPDPDETGSPSQQRRLPNGGAPGPADATNPRVTRTSASPQAAAAAAAGVLGNLPFRPAVRPEALSAAAYDMIPTMAAPHSTSINAVAATPDMRWVFSGGADGYIRKFNWVDTANGKLALTVAQRHPFVDSVTKAGVLLSYWENGDGGGSDAPSPVYSLAVHHQSLWLLSGTESGAINLQSVRHSEGHRIHTLKGHSSAVSVLTLAADETSVLSGSWDKTMHDWDLHTGQVRRSFATSGGQISAIEQRPTSALPVPRHSEPEPAASGTFASTNAARPRANGSSHVEAVVGSPDDSLFGDGGDKDSLFGDRADNTDDRADSNIDDRPDNIDDRADNIDNRADNNNIDNHADNNIDNHADNNNIDNHADNSPDNRPDNPSAALPDDDDDDDFSRAIANGIHAAEHDTSADLDMLDMGGPVQAPDAEPARDAQATRENDAQATREEYTHATREEAARSPPAARDAAPLANGLPHAEHLPAAAPHSPTLPPSSESTFLSSTIDGTLAIWDRRQASPIARLLPPRGTPPWCMNACWSPDGNYIYAGRRNGTVDEYSLHKSLSAPARTFKFPGVSGSVSAVRAMPNGRTLICASYDILRQYDLSHTTASTTGTSASTNTAATPFLIVPGHRTGVISQLYLDPTCSFMISTGGNRGWEGATTEVLLGYEISYVA
ncbi:WD40 repeat-like protein [Didymella exigua CBS 183.55]|uniref:WD40 repeat-like protein n=1 Tax=Didymella exigua CBS 183.55 TaxID=1150837 RepID=A0A6A5RC71_9PLEO|nr:WD40 repeat-like protein [Didymella exigua CBS 183.55]KAF1925841.1 WD40 repeat-like protein [Didymella exigua CBS 183.55]